MIDYKLDHILSFTGELAGVPEVIGPLPEGVRVNFYNTGGEITGPGIHGKVRPVGGDWMMVRRDGIAIVDVRATFETDDGALILVTYNGIGQTTPAGASLRAAPLFETGDQRYAWLTKLQAIAVGERVGTDVKYDVHALK